MLFRLTAVLIGFGLLSQGLSAQTAQITILSAAPTTVAPRGSINLTVRIKNTGPVAWSPVVSVQCPSLGFYCRPSFSEDRGKYVIFLQAWYLESSTPGTTYGDSLFAGSMLLPRVIAVGETVEVSSTIQAPQRPGHFRLYVDMAIDSSHQFGTRPYNTQNDVAADAPSFDFTVTGTPTNDPGAGSNLLLVSGTLAGQNISPSNRTVTVSPGAAITGSFVVEVNSVFTSNAVMSLGVGPSWGTHSTSFTDMGHFSTPATGLKKTVTANWTAPSAPGTYYITAAYGGEYTAGAVFSATNWSYGNPVWNDGNDIADWNASLINTANDIGTVGVNYLFPGGMKTQYVPATAIQVVVASVPSRPPIYEFFTEQSNMYTKWKVSDWGGPQESILKAGNVQPGLVGTPAYGSVTLRGNVSGTLRYGAEMAWKGEDIPNTGLFATRLKIGGKDEGADGQASIKAFFTYLSSGQPCGWHMEHDFEMLTGGSTLYRNVWKVPGESTPVVTTATHFTYPKDGVEATDPCSMQNTTAPPSPGVSIGALLQAAADDFVTYFVSVESCVNNERCSAANRGVGTQHYLAKYSVSLGGSEVTELGTTETSHDPIIRTLKPTFNLWWINPAKDKERDASSYKPNTDQDQWMQVRWFYWNPEPHYPPAQAHADAEAGHLAATRTQNTRVEAGGGAQSFQVSGMNASQSWTPTSDSAWLTIPAGTTRTGNASFSYTVTPNPLCGERVAKVSIGPSTLFVTQRGAGVMGTGVSSLAFAAIRGGSNTPPQEVRLQSCDGSLAAWTVAANQPWLSVSPASGRGSGQVTVTLDSRYLPSGETSSANVVVTASSGLSAQTLLPVSLTMKAPAASTAPTGVFDTPVEGAPVNSSIAVTGWAVDDVGIAHVKIWRDAVSPEPAGNKVYVGDAVIVPGTRPDVETVYSGLPQANRAGWGYMLLTNFLPNGGNGTYKLYAIATDLEGKQTTLGTKTITVDNAHATKPFGAIDTPGQGQTVSGSDYVNFGWALTPQPGKIPVDGSTMTVWIDGAPVGTVNYNHPRADVDGLFPGYANTGGAVGFRYLNTTQMANGLHSIAWSVTDNLGRSDGVGSRFFSVLNAGAAPAAVSRVEPVEQMTVRLGYSSDEEALPLKPGDVVEVRELGRMELRIGAVSGVQLVAGESRELPVGSTLKNGVFQWLAGPGFLGMYELQFLREDGQTVSVKVRILPGTMRE